MILLWKHRLFSAYLQIFMRFTNHSSLHQCLTSPQGPPLSFTLSLSNKSKKSWFSGVLHVPLYIWLTELSLNHKTDVDFGMRIKTCTADRRVPIVVGYPGWVHGIAVGQPKHMVIQTQFRRVNDVSPLGWSVMSSTGRTSSLTKISCGLCVAVKIPSCLDKCRCYDCVLCMQHI